MKITSRDLRNCMVVGCLITPLGCADPLTVPPNAVIGRFGGVRAELIAELTTVRFNLGCGEFRTQTPLVPDHQGRFVLAVQPSRYGGNNVLALRGVSDGTRISFEVIFIDAYSTFTSQFSVTRDEPADFSTVACALTGSA